MWERKLWRNTARAPANFHVISLNKLPAPSWARSTMSDHTAMDAERYQLSYANYTNCRPGYPTPPPSICHYLPHADDYNTITNDVFHHNSQVSTPNVFLSSCLFLCFRWPLSQYSLSPSPFLENRTWITAPSSISSAEDKDTTHHSVSISTAFHPNSQPLPDTIISSFDGVLFYVHSPILLKTSPDIFRPLLVSSLAELLFKSATVTVVVEAPSAELNIILHAVYKTSPAAYSPDIKTIIRAVDRMPTWSIPPNDLLTPSNPLYELLLSYSPLCPLEIYALASHHDLEDMAINVSPHLLSYDLSTITDEMAVRIGPIYLKRLLLLHFNRTRDLKSILLLPPHPHPPLNNCHFEDQKKLTRAWALASAYLIWDARLGKHRLLRTLLILINLMRQTYPPMVWRQSLNH